MLGATNLGGVLGMAPTSQSPAEIKAYAKALCRSGLHLLLVDPATSIPVDMRTPKEIKDQTIAAGMNYPVDKLRYSVKTATTDYRELFTYIDRYMERDANAFIGLAVSLRPSRLVIVDADTTDQRRAFMAWWAACTGDQYKLFSLETVHSPGKYKYDTQTWHHYDGGHWYFALPEGVEIPANAAQKTIITYEGVTFDIMTRGYVLLPPSRRPEGAYEIVTSDYPLDNAIWTAALGHDPITLQRSYPPGEIYPEAAKDLALRESRGVVDTVSKGVDTPPFGSPAPGEEVISASGVPGSATVPHPVSQLAFMGETLTQLAAPLPPTPPAVIPEGLTFAQGENELLHLLADIRPDIVNAKIDQYKGARVELTEGEAPTMGLRESVETWGAERPWAELLTSFGWLATGRDQCGCVTYLDTSRQHGSPKSATAHETGCSQGYGDAGGNLHVWTSNVPAQLQAVMRPGSNSVSKLQFVAAYRYNGSVGAALSGEPGLEATTLGSLPVLKLRMPDMNSPELAEFTSLVTDAREYADTVSFTKSSINFTSVGAIRDLPAPEFLVHNTLERGGFNLVIGAPGVGKTHVVLSMIFCVAHGIPWFGKAVSQCNIGYVIGESSHGVVSRIKALESAYGVDPRLTDERLFILPDPIALPALSGDQWVGLQESIRTHSIGVIVFDTWSRMLPGTDENTAEKITPYIARINKLCRATGCTAIVVHHTTRGTTHERGSTALSGAAESIVLVEAVESLDDEESSKGKVLEVTTTKQKNAPEWEEPMCVRITEHGDSAIITDTDGHVGTIFGGNTERPRIDREKLNLAQVVKLVLDIYTQTYTKQRCTRSELIGVATHELAKREPFTAKATHKTQVLKALNLCSQYQLLSIDGSLVARGIRSYESFITAYKEEPSDV